MTRTALALIAATLCATPALAQDGAHAARLYAAHCAVCHGAGLQGDGPMAELLRTPPPDLTRIAERHGGFPRIGMARLIDGRTPMPAHGGEMPIYGFVFSAMSVILRDADGQTLITSPEVVDLVDWLQDNQF